MFLLLSGQIVHDGENAAQIMVQAATTQGAVARESMQPAWVPPPVVQLVDRGLAYHKAGAMAERRCHERRHARSVRGALRSAHHARRARGHVA